MGKFLFLIGRVKKKNDVRKEELKAKPSLDYSFFAMQTMFSSPV